jgi:hypothetical protein
MPISDFLTAKGVLRCPSFLGNQKTLHVVMGSGSQFGRVYAGAPLRLPVPVKLGFKRCASFSLHFITTTCRCRKI